MSIENPVVYCVPIRHMATAIVAFRSNYLSAYKALHLSRSLYKSTLFMQNKPNFRKSQMNVSIYLQTAYENKSDWTLGENKPNSNPIKPNFQKAQMNVNLLITKVYRKKDDFAVRKNKAKTNPISEKPKKNVNLYVIEDYENETAFRLRKNKPKQSQFQTVHELVNRMNPKLLNFHLKIRKKPKKPQFPPNPANFSSESRISNRIFPVLCVFSVASLLFLSLMDCKILNIEDTPFVRRNQLPAASARANVTAQPAAIITIRAKMMYFTLTSLKKRSKKRKYTPKTAITKAKNAITTSTQHNNAQAGWI